MHEKSILQPTFPQYTDTKNYLCTLHKIEDICEKLFISKEKVMICIKKLGGRIKGKKTPQFEIFSKIN